MRRLVRTAARACALVLVLGAAAFPCMAQAKEFSISGLNIGAALDQSGNLRVIEDRSVVFEGQFSWVEWKLNKRGSQSIEVLGVSTIRAGTEQEFTLLDVEAAEAGYYSVADDDDAVTVRVAFSAQDEPVTFRISYLVGAAVQRYADVGELYWQFVGDETAVPSGPVHIEIKPPTPLTQDQVKAWAHGPLTGVVAIGADGSVALDVPELPANTFVEARLLYPASAFPLAGSIGSLRAEAVIAEEAALAEEANAERRRARITLALAIGFVALLSFGALGYAIWAFVRHGREHKAEFPGQYLREDPRPDLPPGVIGSLWRFGTPENADIAATLMDLADKKVIAMRPITVHHDGILGIGAKDEPSFELGLNPEPPLGQISSTDQILLDLLFREIGAGGVVSLEEIKSYAKDNPKTYTDRIKMWADRCEAVANELGMFEGNSWSWRVGMFLLAGLVGTVGFFASVWAETIWPAVMAVPCSIAIAAIAVFMLRRSKAGNELFVRYQAVRDYLRDFGRLQEVPPQSIVLWNRFLVLAVIFGIATEVINQMRVKVPAVVAEPAFQTTYWWVYSSSGSSSPVASLQGGFASASQIATSEMSSSSGGGGGFSGGGGGGGGGGGFSAG